MDVRDSNGNPMHAYVANTDQLAETLAALAENEIVSGELRYRPIGAQDWTTVDLLDHLQNFVFTLPSITIGKDTAPDGIEVEYEYRDAHDHTFSSGGKLLWTVDQAAGAPGGGNTTGGSADSGS